MGRVAFQLFLKYPRAELTALDGVAEGMKGLDGAASKVDRVVFRLLSMGLFRVITKPHLFAIFRLETCGGVEDSVAIDNRWVGLLATLTD